MQPHSPPPPPFGRPVAPPGTGRAPGGPQPADGNEFTDAVARMFEHRQQAAPEFAPPLAMTVASATMPRNGMPLASLS